jgi:hypothetical protein
MNSALKILSETRLAAGISYIIGSDGAPKYTLQVSDAGSELFSHVNARAVVPTGVRREIRAAISAYLSDASFRSACDATRARLGI